MRRRMLVGAVLVGAGLALLGLLLWGRQGGESTSSESGAPPKARVDAPPPRPQDPKGRGPEVPRDTPTLEHAATEAEGVLEVEVLTQGQPIPGANARLYWHGERDPNLGEVQWRLAGSGVTDAHGRVRLASRPGSYLLAVHARGLAPVLRDVVRPHGVPLTSLRLMLEPGQVLIGQTVVHGSREPLPLVEVSLTAFGRDLEPWQRPEAPAEERPSATSNERGDFRFDGLAPGTYRVEARAAGYTPKTLERMKVPTAQPLVLELAAAGVIEGFVVDAQERPVAGAEVLVGGVAAVSTTTGAGGGFSLEVEPGAHSVSARHGDEAGALEQPLVVSAGKTVRDVRVRLGAGALFEGHVLEQSSTEPVVGAHVDVSPHGLNGDSGRAVTDEAGHFVVRALAPGSYDVVAQAPGHSQTVRAGLTVAAGEHFPLELQLSGTGSVEGEVKTPDGQPIVNAQVMGSTNLGDLQGNPPVEARTDATGHYALQGLSTGRLHLTARREGASVGTSQMVDVSATATQRMDFTLDATGILEGVVRADHGPLPAEPLELTAYAQGRARMGMADIGRLEVPPTGEFRMELPPGRYGLLLTTHDASSLKASRPTMVLVEEGRTAHADLTWEERGEEGTFQGVVVEPDGTPSPRALVTLFNVEGGQSTQLAMAQTNEEGHFTLRPPSSLEGVTSRQLRINARNGGRAGDVLDVTRETPEVTVRLRPGASLQGRVVREGTPVRGFTLSLHLQGPGFLLPEAEGPWEFPGERFELRDVPAEPIQLTVRTQDGASGELSVSPSAGSSPSVELHLRASALVRGRVLDATTHAPLPGVLVFLDGEPSPDSSGGETDGEGRFSLGGLHAGEHTLTLIGSQGRQRSSHLIQLSEGESVDLGELLLEAPTPEER